MTSGIEDAIGAGETMLAADAAAGTLDIKHEHAGEICANCGAALAGQHCHVCGQVADDIRRPFVSLIKDALEGLFAIDGRVLNTVPPLLLRPGRVTADYLAGRRARFVPPFRLFLVSALIFLVAVSFVAGDWTSIDLGEPEFPMDAVSRQARLDEIATSKAQIEAEMERLEAAGIPVRDGMQRSIDMLDAAAADLENADTPEGAAAARDSQRLRQIEQRERFRCDFRRALLPEELGSCPAERPEGVRNTVQMWRNGPPDWPIGTRRYLVHQADVVIEDPNRFLEAVNRWLPRVLIGLFPVYALLLGFMNFWKRRFLFYDHVVVSLHFHAFLFLLLSVLIAASTVIPVWIAAAAFLMLSNLYLYRAHRLVYRCGRFSSALRTVALDIAYLLCVAAFAPLVLAVGGFLTA